ncbi:MAG: Uma2 family endonuclease [Polyangiaceae bacterium]|nr:Uma2 family endonuclease [Polyangiaceae bacterium]
MTGAPRLQTPPDPHTTDHFVYLRDVSWREYEALLAMRGDRSVPRITYLEGQLELMSASRYHEDDKTRFARLLEAWADETGIELEGYGSWTLKKSEEERGAEPDECYTLGRVPSGDDDRPDLAIEVIWTGGGIDKLEIYRKLGVREVWTYERGTLRFFRLEGERYRELPGSELLPAFDPALVTRCMMEPSQGAAVRALRAALREKE